MPSTEPIAEIYLHMRASNALDVAIKPPGATTVGKPWRAEHQPHDDWTVSLIKAQLERLGRSPDAEQLASDMLGQLLFGPEGGRLDRELTALVTQADRERGFIRLLLQIEHGELEVLSRELEALPWELAVWPKNKRWLATDPAFTFTRLVSISDTKLPAPASRPVDVHVVSSMKPGDDDFQNANDGIRRDLGRFAAGSNAGLAVTWSPAHLVDTPSIQRSDVLYFLGHGNSANVTWVDADSEPDELDARQFLDKVGLTDKVFPLIVTLACAGAWCTVPSTETPQAFAKVLIGGGARVVLTMHGSLDIRATPVIVNVIQYWMKEGMPLDRLVQMARCTMQVAEQRDCVPSYLCQNWYKPVLTTSSPGALGTFRDIRYSYSADPRERDEVREALRQLFDCKDEPPLHMPWTVGPQMPANKATSAWFDGRLIHLVESNIGAPAPYLREILQRLRERSREDAPLAEIREDRKWFLVAEAAAHGVMPPGSPAGFLSSGRTKNAKSQLVTATNVAIPDPSPYACPKYYAYKVDGDSTAVQLLGTYGRSPWQRWFAPYGQQRWFHERVTFAPITLSKSDRYALIQSGCSPARSIEDVDAHVWQAIIPLDVMDEWNISCLPPDPKLPPESGTWKRSLQPPPVDDPWHLYTKDEFRKIVKDPRRQCRLLRSAVAAARACEFNGRFKGVVETIVRKNTITVASMHTLAKIFETERMHTKDHLAELEVIQAMAAAVPPGMPRPMAKLWVHLPHPKHPEQQGDPSFITMSDHREWQFRILVALLEALFTS